MKILPSLAGGLAGALSVTILHELIRKFDSSAPRLDLLGEQAASRLIEKTGHHAPEGKKLYFTGLAGDILSNTLYYSIAGTRMKSLFSTGGLLGLSAGVGALALPEKLNLNKVFAGGTTKKKLITVGLYLTGGLVASAVIKALTKKERKIKSFPPLDKAELDITV